MFSVKNEHNWVERASLSYRLNVARKIASLDKSAGGTVSSSNAEKSESAWRNKNLSCRD